MEFSIWILSIWCFSIRQPLFIRVVLRQSRFPFNPKSRCAFFLLFFLSFLPTCLARVLCLFRFFWRHRCSVRFPSFIIPCFPRFLYSPAVSALSHFLASLRFSSLPTSPHPLHPRGSSPLNPAQFCFARFSGFPRESVSWRELFHGFWVRFGGHEGVSSARSVRIGGNGERAVDRRDRCILRRRDEPRFASASFV